MDLSHLNAVDLGVFVVILLSGALALYRGFVREVLSLAAWAGAGIATVYLYPLLRPWMHEHVKSEFGADALTGLTLFCLALAVLIPLGYIISGLVKGRALTAIDRSIGFIFGLARGALVVCLLFLITLWVWPDEKKEPDILSQARTRPFMAAGAETLKDLLPKEEMDKMSEHMKALDKEMAAKAPSLEQLTTPAISNAKNATTVNTAPDATTSGATTINLAPTPQPVPSMPPTPPPPPGNP